MGEASQQRRVEHLNAVLRAVRNVNQVIVRQRDRDALLQSICDSLVETRGYRSAWIVLLDASRGLVASAEAGLEDRVSPFLEELRAGTVPGCVQQAMDRDGVVALDDPQGVCRDCPLYPGDRDYTPMAVRLAWADDIYGVLATTMPADLTADAEECALLEEVAGDIAFALHDDQLAQERARTDQALQLERSRLEALLQLSQMTDAPLSEITEFALEGAVKLTQSGIGYLAFMNEDESVLTMHAWSKSAMKQCSVIDQPIDYPVETTGLWGEAVRQRRPVITNDYASPSPLKKGTPEGHVPILRHMNVPVFEGQRIVAVAGVGNKKEPYDESDVRQLTLLMQGMWQLLQRRREQTELHQARRELEDRVRARTAELGAANEGLKLERYLLHSLMDTLPHNIYFKDAQSRFIRINRALAEYFGLKDPAEALGKTDQDFFVGEHAVQALADEQEILRTGAPIIDKEEKETWPDGRVTWANTTKMPLYDESGRIVGTFGVSRDITERKLAAEALRAAKEQAEAANRAKSDFLANMSHEIRTPLNAIIGMTELVLKTDLIPQQREFLTTVRDSGEALLSVINDVLDFSKIEAGKLVLANKPFDLRESLGDTMKSFAIRAHQQGLELAYRIYPDVPRRLLGDYNRLRQIVVNLVGNAIKFTDEGEVLLEVRRQELRDQKVELLFTVTDTGVGVPAEKHDAIFDLFEQADNSMTRRHGGTGLGLAIVSRLVAMMGGRTWVESVPDEGSRFHFTVRIRLAPCEDATDSVIIPARLQGLRALVVDDNRTNRRILKELLDEWHLQPHLASDVVQAQAMIDQALEQREPFRLVLTDSHMPRDDGFSLVRWIRHERNLHETVVIMLTSGDRPEDPLRCEELGIASFLLKPVKQSELLEAIELALGAPVPRQQLADEAAETPARHGPLRILLAEDSIVNQKLAKALLGQKGHTVTIANNGREAVEACSRESFHVILMDIQMPEMDGLEATQLIRAGERVSGKRTPIIAMTAHALEGDRKRCLDAGMDAYVAKPIRAQTLFDAIDSFCDP